MSSLSDKITSQTQNCSINHQSIEKFLALMATQQKEYTDISYKANGPFALVLRAKKDGIAEVALKVLECTNHTTCQIEAMEREYAIRKQLPFSDYFMDIQHQFFLTETNESAEQGKSENSNATRKVYFVQQMEMCLGSLQDTISLYSEKNKDPPSETFKELLAIQMLDAVNLLHQKHIAHGNITIHSFLVSSSLDYPVLLKLKNLLFTSPDNTSNPENSVLVNEFLNQMHLMREIQGDCLEQDLVSLGKVLLQLDNLKQLTISNIVLTQPNLIAKSESLQLNQSTLLHKIACSLLNKTKEDSQSARSALLLLLQKQTGVLNNPLFSVVLKSHLDSLCLPIPSNRILLDYLLWQVSKECRLLNTASWFDDKGQRKTQLTEDLLKSALSIMLEWKEFSEVYDVVGIGVGGVVFGVENLKEKRKSVLKLSLCTNKAETIREICIRRTCQSPHIVKFYWCKFFQDVNGNEFVVYELERCKYSLIHHLELQRIYGEYTQELKNPLALQIIDSVRLLHQNLTLLRNIKLDSFLITESVSGQPVVKLGNFSHAVQLQDILSASKLCLFEWENPPVNCIMQRHNRENLLYFAPEKWKNPARSTYLTDCFSVGLCILLLDNYLVCSEEQLAIKFLSVPLESTVKCLEKNFSIRKETYLSKISKQLLVFQPKNRSSLLYFGEDSATSQKQNKENNKDFDEDNLQQHIELSIYGRETLYYFKQAPLRFDNIESVTIDLNQKGVEDTDLISLLISNCINLSRIGIIFRSCKSEVEANSLLSPLARQVNLSNVSLDLDKIFLGSRRAQVLLSPLANLLNLQSLTLNLNGCNIGNLVGQSLLSPLANLVNLSSLTLHLDNNQIGEAGTQSLLSPLANLLNLSSLALSLENNQIGLLRSRIFALSLSESPQSLKLSPQSRQKQNWSFRSA